MSVEEKDDAHALAYAVAMFLESLDDEFAKSSAAA